MSLLTSHKKKRTVLSSQNVIFHDYFLFFILFLCPRKRRKMKIYWCHLKYNEVPN